MWNGSSNDAILTDVATNGSQATGIEWDATPPYSMPMGRAQFAVITVTIEGPLEFTAILTFIASCAFSSSLTITGIRAPRFSTETAYLFFPHNWEDGLDESLAWKTDVLVAYNGTEQRVQMRTMPRRSWELRLLVAGAGRRKLETWLGLRKVRQLMCPVWRDIGCTTDEIAASSSLIPVNTTYFDYAVGRPVAVFASHDNFEVGIVSGIGPGFVATEAPFVQNWPAGSKVAPCRYGLALDQRRVSRFNEDVGDYRLTFEAQNETLMPAVATPDTYRTVAVCPLAPTVIFDAEETWDNKWVRLDNDTGVLEYDIQSIEPVMAREVSFLVIGRDRIDTMLRFLFACAGRLTPFWLPATDRGFELAAAAVSGATTLEIANIDYEYTMADCPARAHIEMVTTGGAIIRRKITAVATLPNGNEQWTIDSGLPMDIAAATLNRCAWLELVRLDTDEINLHWVAWDCLEITLPVVALP